MYELGVDEIYNDLDLLLLDQINTINSLSKHYLKGDNNEYNKICLVINSQTYNLNKDDGIVFNIDKPIFLAVKNAYISVFLDTGDNTKFIFIDTKPVRNLFMSKVTDVNCFYKVFKDVRSEDSRFIENSNIYLAKGKCKKQYLINTSMMIGKSNKLNKIEVDSTFSRMLDMTIEAILDKLSKELSDEHNIGEYFNKYIEERLHFDFYCVNGDKNKLIDII